ncbi:MAG: hypothetical protein LBV23_07755 [Deltaproteobacteria bacterium]|nr:hypothetical protein [Deltaproteobacteria bacterium]
MSASPNQPFIRCPNCGQAVNLPAETCPGCAFNFREGRVPSAPPSADPEALPSRAKYWLVAAAALVALIVVAIILFSRGDPQSPLTIPAAGGGSRASQLTDSPPPPAIGLRPVQSLERAKSVSQDADARKKAMDDLQNDIENKPEEQ